jgi:DNA-directed RNA polymerase specialized sigma24 family protein
MSGSHALVQALVQAFRSGTWSPGAETALRQVVAKVFTALRRRFQEADCEDGMAEALLLLAQKPEAYREEEGTLEGFLYVVARNAVARLLRQRARCPASDPQKLAAAAIAPEPEPEQPESSAPSPTQQIRRQTLMAQVSALPAEKQAILWEFANAAEGEPWATQYARRTGDNPNRVRVCLHRMLAQLRKELS